MLEIIPCCENWLVKYSVVKTSLLLKVLAREVIDIKVSCVTFPSMVSEIPEPDGLVVEVSGASVEDNVVLCVASLPEGRFVGFIYSDSVLSFWVYGKVLLFSVMLSVPIASSVVASTELLLPNSFEAVTLDVSELDILVSILSLLVLSPATVDVAMGDSVVILAVGLVEVESRLCVPVVETKL